jgi:hypothetical protein
MSPAFMAIFAAALSGVFTLLNILITARIARRSKPLDKSGDYFLRKIDGLTAALEKIRDLDRSQAYLSDIHLGQVSVDESNKMDIRAKMGSYADAVHEIYLQCRLFVSPGRRGQIAALRSELHEASGMIGRYIAYTKRTDKNPVEEERLLNASIPAVQRTVTLAGQSGSVIPAILRDELEEAADFFNKLIPEVRSGR